MSEWWLWSYVVIATAAVFWFTRWSRAPKGIPRIGYLLVIVILLWSTAWHVVMALGGGRTETAGHVMYWGHYADWIITAPLLACTLVFTATHTVIEARPSLLVALVLLCLPMIMSGPVADLMRSRPARFTAYAVGMLALAMILSLVWGPVRATANRQPAAMALHFRLAALLLSTLWISFSLVWLFGPPGIGIYDDEATIAVFAVLSALMKVGWPMVDLGRLRRLADRGQLHVT